MRAVTLHPSSPCHSQDTLLCVGGHSEDLTQTHMTPESRAPTHACLLAG